MGNKIITLIIVQISILSAGSNDMKRFLPTEGKTFKYELVLKYKDFDKKKINQEKIMRKIKESCIEIKEYEIKTEKEIKELPDELKKDLKGNRLYKKTIVLCSNENSLFYDLGEVLKKDKKEWVQFNDYENKPVKTICKLISNKKETILEKERETMHMSCTYENKIRNDYYIAEGLGVYKGEYELKEYEYKINMILKSIETK